MRSSLLCVTLTVTLVAEAALACSQLAGPGSASADTPVMVASTDGVAPGAPTISNVRLRLAPRNQAPVVGPIASCEPVDALAFDLDGTDDVTSLGNLRAQIFVAADEAALAQAPVKRTWGLSDTFGKPASFLLPALGLPALVDREATPRFCFSVRLVDENANAGPRSQPVCLDPTTAPVDEPLPPVGCAAGPGAPLLVALALLLRQRKAGAGR
ncbi:MAG: hypothetical protein JNJ54_06395 [Myxococcaceae bacterium]|nr:hypothetical protein [Myxococcaceae bacterium]